MYTQQARLDVGLHESNMLNSYNRPYNRLVQRENVCIHDAAGCTIGPVVQQVVACKGDLRISPSPAVRSMLATREPENGQL